MTLSSELIYVRNIHIMLDLIAVMDENNNESHVKFKHFEFQRQMFSDRW